MITITICVFVEPFNYYNISFDWGLKMFRRNTLAILIGSACSILPTLVTAQSEAPPNMEVIVVTASGFEQRIIDAPASISVITSEELQRTQFTNIAEALTSIPGVDVRNGVGKTGGLSIEMRGMPSNYTLILIDGRRQNTSGDIAPNGFGEFNTSFMPPLSAIERIEVIRGPMSTLYGSDAMGGVINIITKPVPDQWGGNITADYLLQEDSDAADAATLNLSLGGPIANNLGLQLRGRVFDRGSSERLNPESRGRDPRPAEGENYSFGGRLSYVMSDSHRFWTEADVARQRYSNADGRLGTLDTFNSDGTPNVISGYADELEFYRDQLAVGHSSYLDFGTWTTSLSRVYTEQLGRTLPAGYAPDFGYDAIGGEERLLENTDMVVESRVVLPIGAHMVTLGAEYKDNEVLDSAAGMGNVFEQDSWSLYAENEWSILPDVRLTFGGRYEDHSAFGGHFTPRAYAVWNSTDRWTLKGGVSTGYKVPSPNALHDGVVGFSGQGATVSLGSPNLQPEETTNYEVSANYTNHQGLLVTGTLFLNQFKNKFATGASVPNCLYTDANTPLNRPGCITVGNFSQQIDFTQQVNLDEAETRGVELTTHYEISPKWDLRASYTWMDTEVTTGKSAGDYLVNNPKHSGFATATWRVNERFNAWLEAEYKSSRERFIEAPTGGENLAIYTATNNKLQGYQVFNLGTTYQLTDNLRVNAVLYNLFDKDFAETRAYEFNNEIRYASMYSNIGRSIEGTYIDGRRLWVSLSYDF